MVKIQNKSQKDPTKRDCFWTFSFFCFPNYVVFQYFCFHFYFLSLISFFLNQEELGVLVVGYEYIQKYNFRPAQVENVERTESCNQGNQVLTPLLGADYQLPTIRYLRPRILFSATHIDVEQFANANQVVTPLLGARLPVIRLFWTSNYLVSQTWNLIFCYTLCNFSSCIPGVFVKVHQHPIPQGVVQCITSS